jgi:hypothetical protein
MNCANMIPNSEACRDCETSSFQIVKGHGCVVLQGELLISSQVTRSQANNLTDAIARLQQLLDEAAESIKPIESDPKKVKALQKRKAKVSRSEATQIRADP